MTLDLIERRGKHDSLPNELASKRRVKRKVQRERRKVFCCDLEGEDFSFICEREDDGVRDRGNVRFRGHDQFEGGPGLEVVGRGVSGAVEFDCWDGGAVKGGGAGEGVAEGELDEAAFVEAARERKGNQQSRRTMGIRNRERETGLTSCVRKPAEGR